jgi:uncharacterized membrane protein/glutaredoxin
MATSTLACSSRRTRRDRRPAAPPPPTWALDRVVLGAAVVGLLISSYLLLLDLTGSSAVCVAGADCDIVRASAYGRVFGLPMALLGVGYFLAVGVTALLRAPWQPRLLQLLGGVGLGAAMLFVVVQGLVLQAWCPYCLVADAAALTIAARVFWRTAAEATGRLASRRAALAQGLAGAGLAVAVLLVGYAAGPAAPAATAAPEAGVAAPVNPEAARLVALADHLRESGAVFYGAYWCPHCQNQKKMFGEAASRLPYVECDPRGAGASPAACQAAGVRAYPTWVIGGQAIEGELSTSELARRSGFPR